MTQQYIYVVGQPDTKSGTIEAIHRLGYKAGLLLDSRLKNKYSETFDRVEIIDFANFDDHLKNINTLALSSAGFICTFENYIVAKAKLSQHFNLPSISVQSAKMCTDKSLMRQAFLDFDSKISPQFSIIDSPKEALDFAKSFGYPLIIKPTGLVKSLLVMRCDNEEELVENVNIALGSVDELYLKYRIHGRKPQIIVEQCMEGDQYSIAAFVDKNGQPHFANGATKLVTAQDIGVDDNYLYKRQLPAEISSSLLDDLLQVSTTGIKALEITSSPAHVELMNTPQGVKIIEIGARIGGYRPRMYSYCYDIDLIDQEIRLAMGQTPNLEANLKMHCAVYEIFPETEGRFVKLSPQINKKSLAYFSQTAKPGDLVGPAKRGYKASVIAIATAHSADELEATSQKIEQLKIEVAS